MDALPQPPAAFRQEVVHEKHGDRRVDPYMWMHDRNSPKVLEHLKAENAYTDAVLKPYAALRSELLRDLRSRIVEDDQSVPVQRRGYSYYTRMVKGGEYPVLARRQDLPKGQAGPEEILLDGNAEAKGTDYFALSGLAPSPDNSHIVYGADTVGRRFYELRVLRVQSPTTEAKGSTAEVRRIPNTTGNVAWAEDNRTLFYVTQDPQTLRSDTVWTMDIHTGQSRKVYHEPDETFSVSIWKSRTNRFLFLQMSSTVTSEVRYLPADKPNEEPRIFSPRQRGLEYSVEDGTDQFYVLTNDAARNFRVMTAPRNSTSRSSWKEHIATDNEVLIEDVNVFSDFIALSEMKDGQSQIRIIPNKGKPYLIAFEDPAYVVAAEANPNFDAKTFRFGYQSLVRPPSVFEHDISSKDNRLLKQQEVPGYQAERYASERLLVTSHDGEKVPLLLVYRKDLRKKGGQPTLLYGYGAYGINTEADFSSSAVNLLDRGFVYALAQVRGGSEKGRRWYEDGRQLAKMNTFKDFIACGDHLVSSGIAAPGRLYAWGGSAGGLLVGASINLRPDLFRGVIAAVPFVDVLTTMLDESIPLTTGEYDEWGNPNDKTFYQAMRQYSPYDNVSKQKYPAMLITSGFHDSQVQYWEPTKWAARLRDVNQSKEPILLFTHLEAGHGGASGRYKRLEDRALEHTFLLMLDGQTGTQQKQ
jgi:oligopeptidase B